MLKYNFDNIHISDVYSYAVVMFNVVMKSMI